MKTLQSTTHFPRWVHWLHWMDRLFQKMGISLITFSEASLIEKAQQKFQKRFKKEARKKDLIINWGDDSFRLGLRALLASIHEDANLSLSGRWLMKRHIINLLGNRLEMQSLFDGQPKILAIPIERPLIITGLPRTGTTLLHRLLAQDPQFRWLRLWELLQPCPPPVLTHAGTDPRIQKAQALARQYQKIVSHLAAAHRIEAQLPEEGNQLFEHAFANFLFSMRSHMPTYENWLRSQDMTCAYQYFRQQLQLLSDQWPGRWLLKAPCHLRDLDALVKVFPDACIVQMHRDPCEVVPSMCSLVAMSRSVFTEQIDPEEVGSDVLDMTAYAHHQGRQFRQQQGSVAICDVDYSDLVRSPIKTVQYIYDFFGDSLSSETALDMKRWLADNPKNKHGHHHYSLEEFGLNKAIIRDRFD